MIKRQKERPRPAEWLQAPSPLNSWKVIDPDQGLVDCPRTAGHKKKVAILGASNLSSHWAPLEDPAWDVWALNAIPFRYGDPAVWRGDVYFELHPIEVQSERDMEFLTHCPAPIYMFERYPQIPNSVRFPLAELYRYFDIAEGGIGDLFACTFAYQIALAIFRGYDEIGLFGVDLDVGSPRERTFERITVAWWAGLAKGRGITISAPPESSVLTHLFRYGFEYEREKQHVEDQVEDLAILAAPWDKPRAR